MLINIIKYILKTAKLGIIMYCVLFLYYFVFKRNIKGATLGAVKTRNNIFQRLLFRTPNPAPEELIK